MEKPTVTARKPMDGEELSNFKRGERITLIFWIIFGVLSLVFVCLYFAFITDKGFLSVVIPEWNLDSSSVFTQADGFDWNSTMAGTYSFSLLDLVFGSAAFSPVGKYVQQYANGTSDTLSITYSISNTQMVSASFYLQIASVALLVLALIGGVIAYFSKKKLSVIPVGFGLASIGIGMMSFGYLLVGATSIVSGPTSPIQPDVNYGSVYAYQMIFMIVFFIFAAIFCAIAPYVIDHRASALYDMNNKK